MASSDQYFAVIPESVLYADISSNAVRVYGVLRRHADKDDGTCHPGRTRIAKLANIHERSVDRALRELESIGAIEVMHRVDPDNPKQFLSNQYRVLTPSAHVTTPRAGVTTPPALVSPPPRAGVAVTKAIEPESENQRIFPSSDDSECATSNDVSRFSIDTQNLCSQLAAWIVANGGRKPNITKTWLGDMDKLIRLDHATPQQIETIIDWCQQDTFWHTNILSPKKLRKQWDTLVMQHKQQNKPSTRTLDVLAVLDNINQQQPALETNNDPF